MYNDKVKEAMLAKRNEREAKRVEQGKETNETAHSILLLGLVIAIPLIVILIVLQPFTGLLSKMASLIFG